MAQRKYFFFQLVSYKVVFILCILFLKAGNIFLLLFFSPIDKKQIHGHESWSLSPEEYEIWDRLYRIKESDGVKELILPQVPFETLENLEEISVSLT